MEALLISGIAAGLVVLGQYLQQELPNWGLGPAAVLILAVAALGVVLQRFVLDRKALSSFYDGLADIFFQINAPARPGTPVNFLIRGVLSFLLAVCSGLVGPEGAAVELSFAAALRRRPRSSQWFEQRRRTDTASALAAGISAAFGAPLTGMLLPMELGMGGRTLRVALCSLVAFVFSQLLSYWIPVHGLFHGEPATSLVAFAMNRWDSWAMLLLMGALGGLFGAGLIRFIRYFQDSLLDLFQTKNWMRIAAGGVLLFLLLVVYKTSGSSSLQVVEDSLLVRRTLGESGGLLAARILGLALVLSAFGTVGLFWPLLALGVLFGTSVDRVLVIFTGLPLAGTAGLAGLTAASALWGAVLGAPLAGAVVIFEMTGNVQLLIPGLAAAALSRWVARRLGVQPLLQWDLSARGLDLVEGRSLSILNSLLVKDAMVTNFETLYENESVAALRGRLLKATYPFLPVINAGGVFTGLLTVDMIQESAQSLAVAQVLEVKDLLYRYGFKTRIVRPNDRLSLVEGAFQDTPCIPVVTDDGRIAGLLFSDNVRSIYDREAARRSLGMESRS